MTDHEETKSFQPGDGVVYRAHPGASGEDGEVIRVSDRGLVFVRYRGDMQAKATPADRLDLIGRQRP